jgi:hypothetical protein
MITSDQRCSKISVEEGGVGAPVGHHYAPPVILCIVLDGELDASHMFRKFFFLYVLVLSCSLPSLLSACAKNYLCENTETKV